MKRFDAPFAKGRGEGGLGCDVCKKGIECKNGYYNCDQDCNWDVCANCIEIVLPTLQK